MVLFVVLVVSLMVLVVFLHRLGFRFVRLSSRRSTSRFCGWNIRSEYYSGKRNGSKSGYNGGYDSFHFELLPEVF